MDSGDGERDIKEKSYKQGAKEVI